MTILESHPPNHAEWQPSAIGEYAFAELNRPQNGLVMGVTSAGVFIKTGLGERVIFLTEKERRGPLSVNLPGRGSLLANVRMGDAAILDGGLLTLPRAGLAVRAEPGITWRPTEPRLSALT